MNTKFNAAAVIATIAINVVLAAGIVNLFGDDSANETATVQIAKSEVIVVTAKRA